MEITCTAHVIAQLSKLNSHTWFYLVFTFFSQTQLSVSLVSLETVRDFKMWMNFLKRSLRHTITLYHFSTILDVKIAMLQHLTVKISIFFGNILKYKKIMLKSDPEITEIYVLTVLTLDYYWVGSLHCTYSTRGGYWGGGSRTFAPPWQIQGGAISRQKMFPIL